MSEAEKVKELARDAAQDFAAAVTVPILYPVQSKLVPVATGTFLDFDKRLFIVTAAHIFENSNLNMFAIPDGRTNATAIRLSGLVTRPKNAGHIDVAVIEVSGSTSNLLKDWRSITPSQTGTANTAGTFVLCGYPETRQRATEDTFECGLITAFTERLPTPPTNAKQPIDSNDLFFLYAAAAEQADGQIIRTPHLRGASGAAIWEYTSPEDGQGLWTAAKALRAVAVQSTAMRDEWFRGKSWQYVNEALYLHDQRLSDVIAELPDR